jgi:hypothetical protein
MIVVKEISFDEAKKMAEEYIMKKEDEYVDPLEIAEALQIPYEQAHEIFLQLIEEGKLKLGGVVVLSGSWQTSWGVGHERGGDSG